MAEEGLVAEWAVVEAADQVLGVLGAPAAALAAAGPGAIGKTWTRK